MEPVGYEPSTGPLYAVKLMLPAYKNLRERTEAMTSVLTRPLKVDLPFWLFMGREPKSTIFVMIFTTDPWWFKKQYGSHCEIAGIRNKTEGVDD